MSRAPIAWYRPPSEDAPDGEAVYGPRDPNMAGMDTGWLPAYAPGADAHEFTGVARRKLDELLASGWHVNGVSIERAHEDGAVTRGAVTSGGMVLWWHPGQDTP